MSYFLWHAETDSFIGHDESKEDMVKLLDSIQSSSQSLGGLDGLFVTRGRENASRQSATAAETFLLNNQKQDSHKLEGPNAP